MVSIAGKAVLLTVVFKRVDIDGDKAIRDLLVLDLCWQ